MTDPVVFDTYRYHAELAEEQKAQEAAEEEIKEMSDKDLIAWILDRRATAFTDAIWQIFRLAYRKHEPSTELDDLLDELLTSENYLTFFCWLPESKKQEIRDLCAYKLFEETYDRR